MKRIHETKLATSLFIVALYCALVSASYAQSMFDKINDFDGDGRADFAVTRNEGGMLIWYIWQTTAGYRQQHWGVHTDFIATGDYDGDGKTDLVVIRTTTTPPSTVNCNFHILRSMDGSYQIRSLPLTNPIESRCVPMQQDYDGDGRTDPATWHSQVTGAYNYYRSSSDSTVFAEFPAGHFPVLIGDTNGNGIAEISSYMEQSPRVVRRLHPDTGLTTTTQFGISGDVFVPADFDGDNIGELAIFRPSTGEWWWINSSNGTVGVERWGLNGDIPVPADYDNDSRTDRAVYRLGSPNGIYYINGSTAGFQAFVWGIPGDSIVRYQR